VEPTSGEVKRHHHLRIARFHQHLTDQLDLNKTPVQFLVASFKDEDGTATYKDQAMRNILGRFGLTGKSQVVPMHQLSDGQRRRVVFAWLSLTTPHMLFLDEPVLFYLKGLRRLTFKTNFLDIETIDALADAINAFDGGVVLISHDFRLIDQVAQEIWIVEDGVEIWDGSIQDLKADYRERILANSTFTFDV
jgi:ATP-binding cassette subfamily F protein 2